MVRKYRINKTDYTMKGMVHKHRMYAHPNIFKFVNLNIKKEK